MKKILSSALIITLSSFLYGQIIVSEKASLLDTTDYSSLLTVLPEKPKPGDNVQIYFNAVGTNLENANSICATYVFISNNVHEFNFIDMTRHEGVWETTFNIPVKTGIVGLMFESDETYLTNNTKGYFIKLYDDSGKETVESKLSYYVAKYIVGQRTIGLGIQRNANQEEQQEIERLLSENPELRGKYINLLLRAAVRNRLKQDNTIVEKIIEEYRSNYAFTEDDYKNLLYGYTVLGNQEKVKEVFAEGAAKLPNALYFKISSETQQIAKAKDQQKQNDLLEDFIKRYSGNIDADRYLGSVAHYVLKKDVNSIVEFFNRFKTYLSPELAASSAKGFPDDSENPKILSYKLELAKYAVDLAEKELANPTRKRPEYASDKSWYRLRKTQVIWNSLIYANILYANKKNSEALKYFDKMALLMPVSAYKDDEMMQNYSTLLVDAKRYDEAEKIIDHAVKTEKVTSGMKETLRRIYLHKYGNEEKYNQYVATFESRIMNRLKEEIKPKMFDSLGTDFTLKDLNGKPVSLSDFRGKIVVLDFWATWCAPCIASFPGMQKAVNKFANDKDVVFLFINTSEKEENIDKKVSKFLKSKNYSFYVLLDKEYKARDAYNARSIPNKIFLDRNGNIRYRSVGYSGVADRLVDEITAIIELIKTL